MRDVIIEKLKGIEEKENVHILLAVESGSRAWGFASPDSDYDVRFIYARPVKEYLRLDTVRDVIEFPVNDVLDINGWDINKMLRLLYRSNPTLFEWMSSPVVYVDKGFRDRIMPILPKYFYEKRGLYHYLSMAKSNYREYLKGEMVKAKKYFYVIRPILACKWIIDQKTSPPMLFRELVDSELPKELQTEVDRLLYLKQNMPELVLIPRVDEINRFLDASILEIQKCIDQMSDGPQNDWEELNRFFLDVIDYGD